MIGHGFCFWGDTNETDHFRLLAATAIALTAVPATAQQMGAFDPARLSALDKTLSADAFQGRGTASEIEPTVIDFIAKKFTAAGLQPGGEIVNGKRSWFQSVPLLKSQIAGTPQISLNENGTVVPLKQGPEIAVIAPLNGAKQVDIANAPLVFVGYGVKAPERHWDDFKGVDLHGKIAVVLVNDPDFETGHGDFGGKAMTYYGRWTYKYEEAARQGALGLLVIHETEPASYGWATVKNSNTNAMFDIVRDHPAKEHPQIEGWIQRDLAVKMFKDAGLDFDALKKQAQSRDFKPVTLKGENFSANFKVDKSVITSHNIVGSGDRQQAPEADGDLQRALGPSRRRRPRCQRRPDLQWRGRQRHRHGGADRARAGLRQRAETRTLGRIPQCHRRGKGFARLRVLRQSSDLSAGNHRGRDQHGRARPARPCEELHHLRQRQAGTARRLDHRWKKFGMVYTPDPQPEAGHFFRSDHFSFAKQGVPAISSAPATTGKGGVKAGKAAEDEYVAKHYHQPSDEWQASWSFTGMAATRNCFTPWARLADSESGRTGARTPNFAPRGTRRRRERGGTPLRTRLSGRASAAGEGRPWMTETLEPALPDDLDERPSGSCTPCATASGRSPRPRVAPGGCWRRC